MNPKFGMTTTQSKPWMLTPAAWTCCGASSQLSGLTEAFLPISLDEMDGVALLNRIDTKFVMSGWQLFEALVNLEQDYWMLDVQGNRLNHYRTLYFDTPDFELYRAHVNERPERYKVRCREYADSHLSFLEMKHRTRKDRTIKERIATGCPVVQITPDLGNWLCRVSPLDGARLEPKLWNTFTRITLVNKQGCERVTLDTDLVFSTGVKRMELSGIAVAEVKMDSARRASPFLAQMRAQRIRAQGFSKYAIGVAMLYDQVKKNAMKPRLLWVEKMIGGWTYHG